jgi:phage terminase large subunit-like protein
VNRQALLAEAVEVAEELKRRRDRNVLARMYPDEGRYARANYGKHLEVIAELGRRREVAMMGGNGVGKTTVGSYITAIIATGRYPKFWDEVMGPRFPAVDIWVAGQTKEKGREITQPKLLGDLAKDEALLGTGMIPGECIVGKPKFIANTNRAVDYVTVRHDSGQLITIGFKSYDQRVEAFYGTERGFIWLDEEPEENIYAECLMRGRTVGGKLLLTFTPLGGFTNVVQGFVGWEKANAEGASKGYVRCTWNDVPHLSEQEKREMLAGLPVYQREAREKGIPALEGGRIYPVPESDIVINPISLPDYWPRAFGFDGGYHNTAAIWGAYDRENDCWYLYSEHKRGEVEIPVHASAIKARGAWIPGVGDAAATSQHDGKKTLDLYVAEGIDLHLADKAVDAGIGDVLHRLTTGRLKVFSTCEKWLDEFRMYGYDDKQRIIKRNDHLMDATRYLVRSGPKFARTKQVAELKVPELRFG